MEDNLIFLSLQMDDDLNFFQMEDDLIFFWMEHNLINLIHMEDDLKKNIATQYN